MNTSIDIDDADGLDPRRLQKPVLVWDGDCGFCKRSVIRLADEVGQRLRYVTYQAAHERFEGRDASDFQKAVHLIEPDGRVYTGAEAIFRALGKRPGGSALLTMYEQVPGFAPITEWGYRLVANHRPLASKLSRRLLGDDLRRPSWVVSRWIFVRLLGLIAFVAFLSYVVQIDGLIGSGGISPAAELLERVRANLIDTGEASPVGAFFRAPTLAWLSASDAALSAVGAAGMVASAALVFGFWPRMMLFAIWALYLSLATVSGPFMGYQWDVLLLETSLLAIFVASPGVVSRRATPVSAAGRAVMVFLLFKLMFMSGVVKLTSGDSTWRDLTAMTYHYWTQPVPSWTSWWAHSLPEWFHKIETLGVLGVEIVVPIFLFAGRRARRAAAYLIAALQVAIMATGNYGFFNLLALALAIFAFDDHLFGRILPAGLLGWLRGAEDAKAGPGAAWRRVVAGGLAAVVIGVSGLQMLGGLADEQLVPQKLAQAYAPFRTINNYGLFRVMTTERPEILVEGSRDGKTWHLYVFPYKPDRLDQRPPLAAPHMPRADWQMWFAALGDCRRNRWLVGFQQRLLEGEDAVHGLLAENPFADTPPKYVRTTMWHYEFTTPAQRAETGDWWRRERIGPYCPALTLRDGELVIAR